MTYSGVRPYLGERNRQVGEFLEAIAIAQGYTQPLIIATKRAAAGYPKYRTAAFIVLNQDGWILTAGAAFAPMLTFDQDEAKIAALVQQHGAFSNFEWKEFARKNPEHLTECEYYWGQPDLSATNISVFENGLAVAQLTPFGETWFQGCYPVFLHPSMPVQSGTRLCRLGYPFHPHDFAAWEEHPEKVPSHMPLPFPMGATVLGRLIHADTGRPNPQARYFETSTPGFKGHLGAPLVDACGVVCGIQTMVADIALDSTMYIHPAASYATSTARPGQRWVVDTATIFETLRSLDITAIFPPTSQHLAKATANRLDRIRSNPTLAYARGALLAAQLSPPDELMAERDG